MIRNVKYQHGCIIPRLELPLYANRAEGKWKCEVCGQRWKITSNVGTQTNKRIGKTRYISHD